MRSSTFFTIAVLALFAMLAVGGTVSTPVYALSTASLRARAMHMAPTAASGTSSLDPASSTDESEEDASSTSESDDVSASDDSASASTSSSSDETSSNVAGGADLNEAPSEVPSGYEVRRTPGMKTVALPDVPASGESGAAGGDEENEELEDLSRSYEDDFNDSPEDAAQTSPGAGAGAVRATPIVIAAGKASTKEVVLPPPPQLPSSGSLATGVDPTPLKDLDPSRPCASSVDSQCARAQTRIVRSFEDAGEPGVDTHDIRDEPKAFVPGKPDAFGFQQAADALERHVGAVKNLGSIDISRQPGAKIIDVPALTSEADRVAKEAAAATVRARQTLITEVRAMHEGVRNAFTPAMLAPL